MAGYVLNAQNLEPIKGILVGLYSDLSDSIFTRQPMLRVSRTDSRGKFIIKGIATGNTAYTRSLTPTTTISSIRRANSWPSITT